MARKKYKLTAPVIASQNYVALGNQYEFRVGFEKDGLPLTICSEAECPLITADATTVMGTDNGWAQKFLGEQLIPAGLLFNGVNYYGTPAGAMALEETTDPETLDLDAIFPTA